ncbi:hypothetical protein B6D60_09400 [candidate division KSB1 bacterium 4484_87]|nr:MAG: hypothetical protein B6D60_09400 [candidate division KSB1 bacterium 4484_87]
MKPANKYLTAEVISHMREEIDQADGNEVFFVGYVDETGLVTSIQTAARGNEFSVLHVQDLSERSDVVIHNHPSGDLTPSPNDMAIANELLQDGIASFIVNNDVSELYAIVEPFDKKKELPLDISRIVHFLEPGGAVSQRMPQYEYRPQQLEMIRAVSQAFNEKKIGVIEAGTGVGKSMAYLIPAIFWTHTNKQRAVVSTRTINLQEQLIYKDIPFLKKALDIEFKAVLVKGRGNYICLRKIDNLKKDRDSLIEDELQVEVNTLLEWAEKTEDGSKSDLNFVPKGEVWELMAAESDNCLRAKCPHFQECFVMKARRRANKADILVVNHHLLFSDLALRAMGILNSVLPRYHHIIFDEAHNLEDIATDYFGAQVTRYGLIRILHRLYNPKGKKSRGYLPILVTKLKNFSFKESDISINTIINKVTTDVYPLCDSLLTLTNQLMDDLAHFVMNKDSSSWNESKIRLTKAVRNDFDWQNQILAQVDAFFSLLKKLIALLRAVVSDIYDLNFNLPEDIYSQLQEIEVQTRRLSNALEAIVQIILEDDEEHVRWIEATKSKWGKTNVRLHISPLDISEHMERLVFDNYKTVIMTSATLAISHKSGNDFTFFYQQTGLHRIPAQKIIQRKIPAPFDYQKQAITAIPTDLPMPDEKIFGDAISDFILQAIQISQGRAFILFTAYGLLNRVYNELNEQLESSGITVFKQGQFSRTKLLQKFKEDKSSVLFATDSFWQGVDVEGDALENVIITKLPFRVPSEPYVEARVEYIERHGGNSFMDYSLPHAVLKLKQGFGRLIRKKTDIGSIFILDKRIVEKFYGRVFLNSLPQSRIITGVSKDILSQVLDFFATAKNSVYK